MQHPWPPTHYTNGLSNGGLALPARSNDTRDPLAAVLSIGGNAGWVVAITLAAALAFHGAAAVRAFLIDPWLLQWAGKTGVAIDAHMQQTIDVDTNKDEPPPPPPPPEDTPKEKAEPLERKEVNPYENVPPPAAAQAGHVLTDDSAPADFTGDGFVQGSGESYVGGRTMAAGTGTAPVRAPVVTTGPAGTGTAPVQKAAAPVDRSRRVALGGSGDWNCGFPAEADAENIDEAYVEVEVTVGPDGRPQKAVVKSDPTGHGFGRHAQRCAMGQAFTPELDRDGRPVPANRTWRIHFER